MDHGVDLVHVDAVDKVFLTCCALHDFILKIDEMDGVWQGEEGMGETDNFAIHRLDNPEIDENDISSNIAIHQLDNPDIDEDEYTLNNIDYIDDNVVNVRTLNLHAFKQKLIEHFDILYHHGKIVWPKRIKNNCRII